MPAAAQERYTQGMRRIAAGLVIGLLGFGCGDDGGLGGTDGGASVDAAPGTPDATPDAAPPDTRTGVIDIFQLGVSNEFGENWPPYFDGARIAIEYRDLASDPAPVLGTGGLGECTVWIYDAGAGPALVDEGTVTAPALVSPPIGECAFADGIGGYECIVQEGTIGAGSVVAQPDPRGRHGVLMKGGGLAPLTDPDGLWMEVDGWEVEVNNGTFGIVNYSPETDPDVGAIMTLLNPLAENGPAAAEPDLPHYRLLAGLGPTSGAHDHFRDLDSVTVDKTAGDMVEAFSVTLGPAGDGFELADTSDQPHALPSTAAAVTFTCADPGSAEPGTCGASGSGGDSLLIVRGRTTDADTTGLMPFEMPAPVTSYAVFECTAASTDSIELTEQAMTHLLSTSPTRIETDIVHVTSTVVENADTTNPTWLRLGHGTRGYTDH